MRILHTADWHLADRLKQIDRTADLQRAVERIAGHCQRESVDVLLIAGDLFSELARPEALQASLAHLSQTFRPFLLRGGTMIAIAGNHDNDIYCETLRRAFQLAAPNLARPGDLIAPGRFYLITKPVHFKLQDAQATVVQFVGMPYPTTSRYLHGSAATSYASFDERCQLLRQAFLDQLRCMRRQLDTNRPAVLLAHINVMPMRPGTFFSPGLKEDITIADPAVTSGWTYVALGHLHGPGKVLGHTNVRYSGSIDRLSITEKDQQKSAVLVSFDAHPGRAHIRTLVLPATPFYDICIDNPRQELPLLHTQHPDAAAALVRCHVRFRHGEDNLHEILAEVSRIFPRCYERTWNESTTPANRHPVSLLTRATSNQHIENQPPNDRPADKPAPDVSCDTDHSMQQIIFGYLASQLADDAQRDEILSLARQLLEESE